MSKCGIKYCRDMASFDFPPRHPDAIPVCDRHFVVLSYIDGTKVMNQMSGAAVALIESARESAKKDS